MSRRKSTSVAKTVGAVSARLVGGQLSLVRKRLRKAGKPDSDPASVHQLRVATRRARAAVELFAPLLAGKPQQWFLKKLRKLRQVADETRNLDVYLARRSEQQEGIPDRVLKQLHLQRQEALKPLQKLATRFSKGDLWLRKQQALLTASGDKKRAKIADQPLDRFAPVAIKPLAEDFVQALTRSDRSAQQLHALRISGKRLRYTLELFDEALPKRKYAAAIKGLEKLQGVLGDLNDLATAADLVEQVAKHSKKRADRQWLKAERKRQRAAFSLARAKFLRGWTQAQRQSLVRSIERLAGKKKQPKR